MSYLDELNTIQRQAVTTTEGPVLVVAGPGSGKTRVLTYRIAHLVKIGIVPYSILALTFTNKAAREMKERIEKVVGSKANQVWAGTFHSIFARILRVEADKIGFPSSFTIYDSDDTKSLLNSIIKEQNLDPKVYNANAIRQRISSAKSNLITPKAYFNNAELRQSDRMNKRPHLHKIYSEYMKRCKKAGAMDFDDLLYQMFYLLHSNPDNVLQKYRDKFKYVMVDEFQDTNYLQYAIVRKLVNYPDSPKNVCAVGDDAQSIYAFRGATIQNILDFEKDYANLKTFKLVQNYRSTEHIVQAANDIISYNKNQIQKTIRSEKGAGHPIKILETTSDDEEGRRVGQLIMEQKTRYHLKNQDVAILYRTNSQSRKFEESLRRLNIAYRVYGGLSFYQRKEIKDLLAYLRATINNADEEAVKRVVNYPKRGIGKTTIDKVSKIAAQSGRTLYQELKDYKGTTRATKAIKAFTYLIDTFKKKVDTLDAYELSKYIAKQSGILTLLKADTSIEGVNRLENVNAFLDGVQEWVENDEVLDDATVPDKKLNTYLQTIALHTDADNENDDKDRVVLMSIHQAKGLEFKSVFVAGLEENLFPSFMSKETPEGIDEERRLFYVAVTRAEQFLTLTYAKSRYKFGEMKFGEPSRFLREISQDHLEAVNPLHQRSRVVGVRPRVAEPRVTYRKKATPSLPTNVPQFAPSPMGAFKPGVKVVHRKFGEGKVLEITGAVDNPVAMVYFEQIDTKKKIMLKYAKMGIL